ncbi:MAG: phage head morphogenesis protein [Methanobrevibacter sp.]|nr:phage head morphogenesis protein [Methanobrevibacter sp.]
MMISSAEHVETNKLLMQCIDFDKDLFNEKTLSTSEEEYFNSFIDGFNKQVSLFSKWLESEEAIELFGQQIEYNDVVFDSIRGELEQIVHETNLSAEEIIERIYESGLDKGFKEIRRTKYYNEATKYGLKILQQYNFQLIQTLNTDVIEHIRTQIFLGIAEGEGMPEVMRRILNAHEESLTGKTLTARQRAMMIARTETARAMTQGRLQSYANYGVEEIKILTAEDTNVCPICLEAAYIFNGEANIDNVAGERIWKITEANKLVPFHPNCRCSVIAYIRHVLGPNPVDNPVLINLVPA